MLPATRPEKKQRLFLPALRLLVRNFFQHNVGRSAAALAYYLLFAMFPLLIFISNLLGLLDLRIGAILRVLQRVMPADAVGLVETYLEHISHSSSQTLLWFSLIFTIWFPMRAVKGLMDDVRLAHGLKKPKNPIAYTIRQLLYTVVFLAVILLTLLFTTVGKRALQFVLSYVPENIFRIPAFLLNLWQYLRFLPVAVLMLAALGTLYAISLDKWQPLHSYLPGMLAALIGWLAVSVAFSFYVEHFANYSIIYGTLGAVIVLLMWLYITAVVLIMGAELNAVLLQLRQRSPINP